MRSQDDYWYAHDRNRREGAANPNPRYNQRDNDYYRADDRNYSDHEPNRRYPEDNRYYNRDRENNYNPYGSENNRNYRDGRNGYRNDERGRGNEYDWQDYDRNRRQFEYHPNDHQMRDERNRESYNERPWGFDRFAEKIEGGFKRWVNRDYSHHTPDSDFSW